jgi:hypothetical protein
MPLNSSVIRGIAVAMIVYQNNKKHKQRVKEAMGHHHLPYPTRPITSVLAVASYSEIVTVPKKDLEQRRQRRKPPKRRWDIRQHHCRWVLPHSSEDQPCSQALTPLVRSLMGLE